MSLEEVIHQLDGFWDEAFQWYCRALNESPRSSFEERLEALEVCLAARKNVLLAAKRDLDKFLTPRRSLNLLNRITKEYDRLIDDLIEEIRPVLQMTPSERALERVRELKEAASGWQ